MKKIILLLLIAINQQSFAQINIIPAPAQFKILPGNFIVSASTSIIAEGSHLEKSSGLLSTYLQSHFGIELNKKPDINGSKIILNFERLDHATPGAYTIRFENNTVFISGDNEEGVFYGIQTFIQLLPPDRDSKISRSTLSIPRVSISDYPRFAYRGAHLDVCRHFFSVEEVKRYIDWLAVYKFNRFHWHLTDDQGWRIEIKKYPALVTVGGYRNGTIKGRYPGTGNDSLRYGGYYTQQQISEVVKYAEDRYIDVIPEIEMPGHASAAIAAYPWLSCFPTESTKILPTTTWAGSRTGKQVQQTWGVFEDVFCPSDSTFSFLQDVLDEVMPLFPSKFVHIGGDECPKDSWKRSAFCQELIRKNGLKDEHGLQSYFIQRIEKYINSKGKMIIGWDEILEGGLAPNATVMSWRGEEGGIEAAKQNHQVIMTPGAYCYLDHSQSKLEDSVTIGGYLPIEKVYGYEPVSRELSEEQGIFISGAQVNLWTEYIGNESKLQYMFFPRMIAFSEVVWTPKEKRNWSDFENRLPANLQRLDKAGVNYSKAYFELSTLVKPALNTHGIIWEVQSNGKADQQISITYSDRKQISVPVYDVDGALMGSKEVYSDSTIKTVESNDKKISVNISMSGTANASLYNVMPLATTSSTLYNRIKVSMVSQTFQFNMATGKQIFLAEQPSSNYPGNGGFTLVDGVQNSIGLVRSAEFIGFNGKDMEAKIDFVYPQKIGSIILHCFEQVNSWIYRPTSVSFYSSSDYEKWTLIETIFDGKGKSNLQYKSQRPFTARYIKIIAKNAGKIPEGNPGSGKMPWLFADEIEVN